MTLRRSRMTAKLTAPAIETDALTDLVVSRILAREAELVSMIDAGLPMQQELLVVRALLRSIRQLARGRLH
jgi:hypothetical protein